MQIAHRMPCDDDSPQTYPLRTFFLLGFPSAADWLHTPSTDQKSRKLGVATFDAYLVGSLTSCGDVLAYNLWIR